MAGNINKALTQPNAIALTEYQAKIFFGNEDPIGKTFSAKYAYENETITYEVAAVIKEYPQSFLKFNAIGRYYLPIQWRPYLITGKRSLQH